MQILITLQKERIRLPIATSEILQGLIYHALRSDIEYSNKVHNEGLTASNRRFKAFSFGELKGRYEIDGKEIIYLSAVSLEVRSEDAYFIQLLFKYFTNKKVVRLGNNDVEVVGVELKNETIFDDMIRIKTISPITVYETSETGHTTYYSPDEPEFYSAIIANARRKWQSYYGIDVDFDFTIAPDGAKFIKRATRYKNTFITAWHGSFMLKGSLKILNFLYNTGLGSKNSQGFGLFEIL